MAKPLAIKETAKSSTQHACYKLTHTIQHSVIHTEPPDERL